MPYEKLLKAVIQFDFVEFVNITVFYISTSFEVYRWREVYRWHKVVDCDHLDYLCLKAHGWHTRSLLEHSVLALRFTDGMRALLFFILFLNPFHHLPVHLSIPWFHKQQSCWQFKGKDSSGSLPVSLVGIWHSSLLNIEFDIIWYIQHMGIRLL